MSATAALPVFAKRGHQGYVIARGRCLLFFRARRTCWRSPALGGRYPRLKSPLVAKAR